MADDQLQSLLNRINREGLKRAEEAGEKRLAEARAEAERILAAARAEAEQLTSAAEREAGLLVEKGRESLRQAARDVLLSLRTRLEERLLDVARFCVRDAADARTLGDILAALINAYVDKEGAVDRIDALLSKDQLTAVEAVLTSRLGADLRDRTELAPTGDVAGGFRLVFNGGDVVYDFSDEALAQALCTFLSPKLAELVRPKDA